MAEIEELKAQIAVLTAALAQRDEALRFALDHFHDRRDMLGSYERTAELYHAQFGQLAPGKSEPLGYIPELEEDDNRGRYDKWRTAMVEKAFDMMRAALSAAPRDETCAHEFETLRDPNTPDGPGDIHIVCKHCGAERNED